jgi:hypothetical protein
MLAIAATKPTGRAYTYLVRPDVYIGYRSPTINMESLRGHLDDLFIDT